MSSAVKDDKKYDEGVYHYKRQDTSNIHIKVGTRIYLDSKYYGIVVKKSEIFYYIQKENDPEMYEFMLDSLEIKVANEILQIEND